MAGRRRVISSSIFYSAVLACGLVGLYQGVKLAVPQIERWGEQWRLQREMRSTDPRSRLGMVLAMEAKDPSLTTPYLVQATGDPDAEVRVAACHVLASRGQQRPLLISVLSRTANDARDKVRVDTALALGRILAGNRQNARERQAGPADSEAEATAEAGAILCQLLKDPQSEVRAAAAEGLAHGGPEPAPAELGAAAADADREVKLAVARALLRRNGPEDRTAAQLLCGLIADPAPIADRFQILKMVQGTTQETQDRAVRALAALLSRVDASVLPDVIACLGESGRQASAALPVLDKLLDDPEPSTRASAALALLAIDEKPTPRVLAVLVEMLANKDLPQDWRMDAMGRIKGTDPKALAKATPALIRQLGDKSPDIRRAAVELLMSIVEDTPAELPGPTEGK